MFTEIRLIWEIPTYTVSPNFQEANMVKVDWDQESCFRSGDCAKNLPKVFKMENGTIVIDESAGSDEDIRARVTRCPSGALSIRKE